MNQHSRGLLTKLLDKWQRKPESQTPHRLPITEKRAPEYFADMTSELRTQMLDDLRAAERVGAVGLEWNKDYFTRHILKRLTLYDHALLSNFLGVPLATDIVQKGREGLTLLVDSAAPWIGVCAESILSFWSKNKASHGMEPGDFKSLTLLLRALIAVSEKRHINLDLRTFSVRCFEDSKAFESIQSRFADAWKKYAPDGQPELNTDEVLASLGIAKFPLPLLLRGPVLLKTNKRDFNCTDCYPFVGLPPQAIVDVLDISKAAYLLTIENLTTFNRYAAEIDDDGIVLYTGGFPSPEFRRVYQLLVQHLGTRQNVYHWGDIDEGGVKIMACLQKSVKIQIRPHLMSKSEIEKYGQKGKGVNAKNVEKQLGLSPGIDTVIDALRSLAYTCFLEQECIDPKPPIL